MLTVAQRILSTAWLPGIPLTSEEVAPQRRDDEILSCPVLHSAECLLTGAQETRSFPKSP